MPQLFNFLQNDTAVSQRAALSFGVDDKRVDVQLGDFRVFGNHDGKTSQGVFQSRQVVLTQTSVFSSME